MMPRPKTGETPIRHVRVSDALWRKVGVVAGRKRKTLSAVVVDALERHVAAELGEEAASSSDAVPPDKGKRSGLTSSDE
jgi:hypothetical protein